MRDCFSVKATLCQNITVHISTKKTVSALCMDQACSPLCCGVDQQYIGYSCVVNSNEGCDCDVQVPRPVTRRTSSVTMGTASPVVGSATSTMTARMAVMNSVAVSDDS